MNAYGKTYIFEWFDIIISQILNQANQNLPSVSQDELDVLSLRAHQECLRLQSVISSIVFATTKEKKKTVLISQYLSTLSLLHKQVVKYREKEEFDTHGPTSISNVIQSCLEALISFLETRFLSYINPDEQISSTYFSYTIADFKTRLEKINRKFAHQLPGSPALQLVMSRLNLLLQPSLFQHKITYRMITYSESLTKGLQELRREADTTEGFTELDKLLFYLNFNSKSYIKLLVTNIREKIGQSSDPAQQILQLHLYHKSLRQTRPKPQTIFNPQYYDLHTVMNNWFFAEILYLKETLRLSVKVFDQPDKKSEPFQAKHKIVCNMSTDQIGLILRAADESKVISARSMNAVFKTIVPHLSTPNKVDLSYDSLRTKTYNVEERDREVAIQLLQQMIRRIEDF